MFSQKNRLTKDKEFDNVFKNGRSSYDKLIGVKAVRNGLPDNRFGIMVSVKVSKKAVERNKVKRRIRESVKAKLPAMKPGYDCVIIALPEVLEKDSGEIEKSVGFNFKRLRLC